MANKSPSLRENDQSIDCFLLLYIDHKLSEGSIFVSNSFSVFVFIVHSTSGT